MLQAHDPVKVRASKTLRPGDHVRVWRGCYWHHAIYVGNGWFIEFGGGLSGGHVEYVSWGTFARGSRVERVEHERRYSPDQVVERAQSCLGMSGFSLLTNNCEHFANWCVAGRAESHQVQFAGGALALFALYLLANHSPNGRTLAA